MTLEQLQARRAELMEMLSKHQKIVAEGQATINGTQQTINVAVANQNAVTGAIQEVDNWIAKMKQPGEPVPPPS